MGRKNKNNRVVYSTNPDFEQENDFEEMETLSPTEQLLEVHLDILRVISKRLHWI